MTRSSRVLARFITDSISFLTIRPTGTPVQSATTDATACASTLGRIKGVSPWISLRLTMRPFSSVTMALRSFSENWPFSVFISCVSPVSDSASVSAPVSSWGESLSAKSSSTGSPVPARSLPRRIRILSTRSFSCCHSFSSCSRSPTSWANCSSISVRRSWRTIPTASSLVKISSSISSAEMRRRHASTAAGVACRLTATRAQAVSSRLTDLSGNWRAGI